MVGEIVGDLSVVSSWSLMMNTRLAVGPVSVGERLWLNQLI